MKCDVIKGLLVPMCCVQTLMVTFLTLTLTSVVTPAIGQGLTDDEIKSFVDMNVKNIYKKHKRRGRQEGQSINVGVRKPREANDTAEEEIEDHPHPFHRHPRIHKDSK